MVCYIIIVNNVFELQKDKLNFGWVDYYENRKKVGVCCKIYSKDDYDPKKDGSLDVIIYYDKRGFTIKGSLRKFYYGKRNAAADLSIKNFCRCISRIAYVLKVPSSEIWYSDFTFLEFGANIKLPAAFRILLNCLSTYTRRKKRGYESETIYFYNGSKENKFYDKLSEVYGKFGMSKSTYEKLAKYVFIFRYEVRLKPKNIKDFSGKNVIDIYKNWNLLIGYWQKEFEKVQFENRMPIDEDSLDKMIGIKEIKNHFISYAIGKMGGLDEAKKIIYQTRSERKAQFFRSIAKTYQPNYEAKFVKMIERLNTEVNKIAKAKTKINDF